jgi:hypothetical protein
MTRLILKIVLINIGLFIFLIIAATLIGFLLGYASKNSYNKQLLILYTLTALVQVGLNYLIYKKQVSSDWKVLAAIVLIVAVFYLLYPLLMR